jgi:hypothetical protein
MTKGKKSGRQYLQLPDSQTQPHQSSAYSDPGSVIWQTPGGLNKMANAVAQLWHTFTMLGNAARSVRTAGEREILG